MGNKVVIYRFWSPFLNGSIITRNANATGVGEPPCPLGRRLLVSEAFLEVHSFVEKSGVNFAFLGLFFLYFIVVLKNIFGQQVHKYIHK